MILGAMAVNKITLLARAVTKLVTPEAMAAAIGTL